MNIRLASSLQYDSIVDGEGLRTVLWTQGCPHNCEGCHNPTTHSFNEGYITTTDELIKELDDNFKYQDGITLSGGDPFMQAKAVNEIANYVKKTGKNVWAYTGFLYEDLLEMAKTNSSIIELLNNVDVLIDGKFNISEFSLDLYYRGSRNQRVINVKESLKQNKVILIEKFMKDKQNNNLREKSKYIFV